MASTTFSKPVDTEIKALNNKITTVESVTGFFTNATSFTYNLTMERYGKVITISGKFDNFNGNDTYLGDITKNLPVGNRVYAAAIRNDTGHVCGTIYLNTNGQLYYYGDIINAELIFSITYITS